MTLLEAHEECNRWLAYIKGQEDRACKLAQIASDRRLNKITDSQARTMLRTLDRGPTVFDGARLADAVRFLLKITGGKHAKG